MLKTILQTALAIAAVLGGAAIGRNLMGRVFAKSTTSTGG
jgi:hypothetical protein